jgi:hypothetical protein
MGRRKVLKNNDEKETQEGTTESNTPKKKSKVESLPGLVVPKIQNIEQEAAKYYGLLNEGITGYDKLCKVRTQIKNCSTFEDAVTIFESELK